MDLTIKRLPIEKRLLTGYPVGIPRINQEASEEIIALRSEIARLKAGKGQVVYLVDALEVHGDTNYIAGVFTDKLEAEKFAAKYDVVHADDFHAFVTERVLDENVGLKVVKKTTEDEEEYYQFEEVA